MQSHKARPIHKESINLKMIFSDLTTQFIDMKVLLIVYTIFMMEIANQRYLFTFINRLILFLLLRLTCVVC